MSSDQASLFHDPGGKSRIAVSREITSTAVFGGPLDCYRYRLIRTWTGALDAPHAMFVMMNPSVADETSDDPTVAKISRYARAWGYSGVIVCNTFAYRATDQRRLLEVDDPVGPKNDEMIVDQARQARIIVMAYGTPHHQALRARGPDVAALLRADGHRLHVLRLSKAGIPVHPLYLPGNLEPLEWRG